MSLPTRERGLKELCRYVIHNLHTVAPYAGAWIESLGLCPFKRAFDVAPYAGAWIERSVRHGWTSRGKVAPYAGAWIERVTGKVMNVREGCRSLRGSVD